MILHMRERNHPPLAQEEDEGAQMMGKGVGGTHEAHALPQVESKATIKSVE